MRTQRLWIFLTLLNSLILIVNLSRSSVHAADIPDVLRGHALEIVDSRGVVRAEILVHGPETVQGHTFPETVLFRMADQHKSPNMKLTVSEEGSAMLLSDNRKGGIQSYASGRKGTYVRVISDGREQTMKP